MTFTLSVTVSGVRNSRSLIRSVIYQILTTGQVPVRGPLIAPHDVCPCADECSLSAHVSRVQRSCIFSSAVDVVGLRYDVSSVATFIEDLRSQSARVISVFSTSTRARVSSGRN